jgi:hypothetical protein
MLTKQTTNKGSGEPESSHDAPIDRLLDKCARQREVLDALLDASHNVLDAWETNRLAETVRDLAAVVAETETALRTGFCDRCMTPIDSEGDCNCPPESFR